MFFTSCFSKALLFLTLCQALVFVHGKHHLKESRIQAVRGQILTKLGLTSPPDEGTSVQPKREDLEAFKAVSNEAFQQNVQEDCIRQNDHAAGYFAKSVVSLRLIRRTGKTRVYQDSTTKRLHNEDINTLTFDATQISGEYHIERAEIRIDPNYFLTIPPTGTTMTACLDQPSNSSTHNTCVQVLDSRFIYSQGDVSLDVTDAIKRRVIRSKSKATVNIILKIMDQNSSVSSLPSRDPYVLVWYVPTNLYRIDKRRRNRRALDSAFCNQRPKETRCCLRSLYIDFQKDLKWTWIHAPLGFHANFCKGKCPFLWGSTNQTHHTSIMALLNSLNPNAASEPCCVASSYKPLVILHYVKGQPKIEQLSNMVVTSCTCL